MLLLLAPKRVGRGDGGKFLSKIKGPSNGKNKRLTSCFTMDRIFVNVELSFHGVEGQMAVYTTQRTKYVELKKGVSFIAMFLIRLKL